MTGQPEPGKQALLPMLPEPPPPIPDTQPGYSPLSLFALGSLILAAGYALVVFGGGLICWFLRVPLLLPLWSLLVPVAVGLCCVLARYRIRTSEGTLSGLSLTTWGLSLCLLAGLGYTAYYTAIFLAVRNQAQAATQKWLDSIRKGQIEQAFWHTAKPAPTGLESRQDLEIAFNTGGGPNPMARGPFSAFKSADFVHLIEMGGEQTTFELKGVEDWGWEKDGYLVKLRYLVTTPDASFTLVIATLGQDGRSREQPGRQWLILMSQTQLDQPQMPFDFTEAGKDLLRDGRSASAFTQNWIQEVNTRGLPELYPLTLPAGTTGDAEGLKKYHKGGLLRSDPSVFWAPDKSRGAVVAQVEKMFDPGSSERPLDLRPLPTQVPEVHWEGKQRFFYQDLRFATRVGGEVFQVEARLVLGENPAGSSPAWYVKSLELISARSEAPPGAGGPMPRPMPNR